MTAGTTAIWLLIGLVWGVEALRGARQSGPPVAARSPLGHYVLLTGTWILFTRDLGYAPLAWRVLPAGPASAWIGLTLTCVGAAVAIGARLGLGRQWSSRVRIAGDHQLVRDGLYAYVRHPIYAGLLLAALGTAIVIGEVRAAIGLGLWLVALLSKARAEEELLVARFGDGYVQYRHQVKAIVPYLL